MSGTETLERANSREWVDYENDEGAIVTAHRVTPDTSGPVVKVGGGRHVPVPGEVLVRSQNANMYDVFTSRAFDEMFPRRADGKDEDRFFEPSGYTAREVRDYLERVREDDPDEYDRVVDAERSGRNRSSAIPK